MCSKVSIDIFGSCVSRDVFNFDKACKYDIRSYFSRSSLVSLYSTPIDISLEDIASEDTNLLNNFAKKMVHHDLTKKFRTHIKESPAPYLIIDFIDERFNVIRNGDTYFTESLDFVKSNCGLSGEKIGGSMKTALWKYKAKLFIEDIVFYYEPQKIILHKAFWRNQYIAKDGVALMFKDQRIPFHDRNNELLRIYYDFIEINIPNLKIIEINDFYTYEMHEWGLAPFHYQDEYYREFLRQLEPLCQ